MREASAATVVVQLVVRRIAQVLDLARVQRVHLHALAALLLHRHCLHLSPALRPHHQQTALVHVARARLLRQCQRVHQLLLAEQVDVATPQPHTSPGLRRDHHHVLAGRAQQHRLLVQLDGRRLLQRHQVREAHRVVPAAQPRPLHLPADRHAGAVALHRAVAVALVVLRVTPSSRPHRDDTSTPGAPLDDAAVGAGGEHGAGVAGEGAGVHGALVADDGAVARGALLDDVQVRVERQRHAQLAQAVHYASAMVFTPTAQLVHLQRLAVADGQRRLALARLHVPVLRLTRAGRRHLHGAVGGDSVDVLAVRLPAHAVQALCVPVGGGDRAQELAGLAVSRAAGAHLALEEVDRLVAADRHEVRAVGGVAASEPGRARLPDRVHEVLVVGVGVVELERRALVEGHQHVVRGAHQAEGAAGAEVNATGGEAGAWEPVHTARVAGEFAEIGARVPHERADHSTPYT